MGYSATMVSQVENPSGVETAGAEAIQQTSVIPFRMTESGIEICLITSRRKKRWIFPKGPVEGRLGPIESVQKIAADEGGLSGSIESQVLGSYKRLKEGNLHKVEVYLMKVDQCAEVWLESRIRERRWVSVEGARKVIGKPELLDMLKRALERLS